MRSTSIQWELHPSTAYKKSDWTWVFRGCTFVVHSPPAPCNNFQRGPTHHLQDLLKLLKSRPQVCVWLISRLWPSSRSAPRMFSNKISITISNLDMLGCCWSCRCDPLRQWQNRNTMRHTGVTSVECVETFAWNDYKLNDWNVTKIGIVKCQRLWRVLVLLDWVSQIFR